MANAQFEPSYQQHSFSMSISHIQDLGAVVIEEVHATKGHS